jgi:hypothetical protein
MKAVAGDRELRACLSTAHVLRIDCCAGAEERTLLCIDAKTIFICRPAVPVQIDGLLALAGATSTFNRRTQVTRGTEPLESIHVMVPDNLARGE